MNLLVTVYTKNGCAPCMFTKKELNKVGVEFQEVSMDDPEVLDSLIAKGHSAAPVVETPSGESWSGFKPDMIRSLV